MIPIIDISQRIEFISKEDKGEPQTIFVLRPLNGIEKFDLLQHSAGKELKLEGKYITNLLKKSIVEVKNYPTENADIDDILMSLPDMVVIELVGRIGALNNITEQEEKN